MPIFEYACAACGREFELLVRSSSEKAACPHCASARVQKRFSTFGVATGNGTGNACGMPEASAQRFAGDCGAPVCRPGGCQ